MEEESDVADVHDDEDVSGSDTDPDSASDSALDSDVDTDADSEPDSALDPDPDDFDGSSEGSGWFADPDVEGQERYYDGSEWTSETRPADVDAPLNHLPDHAGELQRALAAATDDIDDVEDRLGTLFDRAEQQGERGGRARQQAAAADRRAPGRRGDAGDEGSESEGSTDGGAGLGDAGGNRDDDDAFAELDEALASEEPEPVAKKGFFRRRS